MTEQIPTTVTHPTGTRPSEVGITYCEIGDSDLKVALKAGELARFTLFSDRLFQQRLSQKGISFDEVFQEGDEAGLNLDYVLEKIEETDELGTAIRCLTQTIGRIGSTYRINSYQEEVVSDLSNARSALRERHRMLKEEQKKGSSKRVDRGLKIFW